MTEVKPYKETLFPFFDIKPDLTFKIAKEKTNISKAQFHRVKNAWIKEQERKIRDFKKKNNETIKKPRGRPRKHPKKKKDKSLQMITNNSNRNQSKTPKTPLSLLPLPKDDPGFEKFCRWYSYPAYRGLYKWQIKSHNELWSAKYSMELVARDHGKSVKYNNEYQWAIKFKDFDVLLLGWTDRRKEIALYVYTFFSQRDLILRDKRTSPFHFRTKNGGKFDCYLITGKETLGMHPTGSQDRFSNLSEEEIADLKELYDDPEGDIEFNLEELDNFLKDREGSTRKLWVSIDDPIDISYMKERWKEDQLELRFNSTLYSINPDKWSFTGTHKFEGDVFDFWDKKFEKDLKRYVRGPINEDGTLLCPEKFTHPSLPTYEHDLEGKHPKKCLAQIRKHIGEYAWFSEWCQSPHPITGEVWDKVIFENFMKSWIHYDICLISLDRATTQNPTSSYTGYTITLREKKTGDRLTIGDHTKMWIFEDLLIHVNNYIYEFHKTYENLLIFLIVEKQGGGDDFESAIRSRPKFFDGGKEKENKDWPKNKIVKKLYDKDGWVLNKILDCATIVMLHSVGKKEERIKTFLFAPIVNGRHKFLKTLEFSEVVARQLLPYPNSSRLDGLDTLANTERALDVSDLIPKLGEGKIEDLDKALMYLQEEDLKAKGSMYNKEPFDILKSPGDW